VRAHELALGDLGASGVIAPIMSEPSFSRGGFRAVPRCARATPRSGGVNSSCFRLGTRSVPPATISAPGPVLREQRDGLFDGAGLASSNFGQAQHV
jgi:hypothetical protein